MRGLATSMLELALRAAAGFSVVMALLWVLGPTGVGAVSFEWVPGAGGRGAPALSSWTGEAGGSAVVLSASSDNERLWELRQDMGATREAAVPAGHAEVFFSPRIVFFKPAWVQRFLFVFLNAGTWLVIAALWWLLAGVARVTGRGSPFTAVNARRLRAVGWVVLVGAILHFAAERVLIAWMVESSTLGDRVDSASASFASLPWSSVAAGAGVLAIAAVWRRGVVLEAEIEDLV